MIARWLSFFLRFYDIFNMLFNAFRCYGFSVHTINGTVEKIFKFKNTLRSMDIFVCCHPADCGFVHFYMFRHISKYKGL